jgi:hypothetical protein
MYEITGSQIAKAVFWNGIPLKRIALVGSMLDRGLSRNHVHPNDESTYEINIYDHLANTQRQNSRIT